MDEQNLLIKLQDLSQLLAVGNLSDSLNEHAAMAARLLDAETCSVRLITNGEGEDLRMTVSANSTGSTCICWT